MRIDEARHAAEAAPVYALPAFIACVRPHDAVADDRHVRARNRAGDDIEHVDVGDDEIGGLTSGACGDGSC